MSNKLRITNPGTLFIWKKTGKYKKMIDDGFIYNEGCGIFKKDKCKCNKCNK